MEAAAAAEHGTAEMHVDERTGFAQGVDNHDSDFAARSTLKVETTTVDAARKADGRKVALLKIDVEGFEDQVLQGSRDTLSRDRPTVFLELHHNVLRDRGVSSHKMFDSLARLRYSLIRLNGKPVNLGAAVAAGSLMPRAHVLAVPCEQSSLLRASMRLRR
ncbi:MAG: FkbM family methyltransferase [Verrucomicrobiota bacterium]